MKSVFSFLPLLLLLSCADLFVPSFNFCHCLPNADQYSIENSVAGIDLVVYFDLRLDSNKCIGDGEIRAVISKGFFAGDVLIQNGGVCVNGKKMVEAQGFIGGPYYYSQDVQIDFRSEYQFIVNLSNGGFCTTTVEIPDTVYYSTKPKFGGFYFYEADTADISYMYLLYTIAMKFSMVEISIWLSLHHFFKNWAADFTFPGNPEYIDYIAWGEQSEAYSELPSSAMKGDDFVNKIEHQRQLANFQTLGSIAIIKGRNQEIAGTERT